MIKRLLTSLIIVLLISGCTNNNNVKPEVNSVYYEIFVSSFYDSDGDGQGDLEGIRQNLDYIQNDLGATGIWLMPIHPSPTYHKYDVLDYEGIDPQYGTMEDFENLVNEMNERDMDLIIDYVLNHSSSEHPWFKKAVTAKLNDNCDEVTECGYYNFTDHNPGGWHRITDDLFYEGGFWSEMPDLNLYNEELKEILLDSAKFWLDKGVKGFRLDATTHFFDYSHEDNVEFLSWFSDEVKKHKEDAYIVAEAWTGKTIIEDMYRSGVDSFFNFTFAQNDGNIIKNMRSENGLRLSKAVEDYTNRIKAKNPNAIDAPFLSNHDNNRSAGYLNTLEDQKLAASLYLLMPGNPFIYYGEELGMKGSGIDENKRLAFLWDTEDTKGYTKDPKNADYKQEDRVSVKEAKKDKNSLLNHYKHVINLRNKFPEIARGEYSSIDFNNDVIYGAKHDNVIVVHNLSEEKQSIELDAKKIHLVMGKYKNNKGTIELDPLSSIIIEE